MGVYLRRPIRFQFEGCALIEGTWTKDCLQRDGIYYGRWKGGGTILYQQIPRYLPSYPRNPIYDQKHPAEEGDINHLGLSLLSFLEQKKLFRRDLRLGDLLSFWLRDDLLIISRLLVINERTPVGSPDKMLFLASS